MYATIIWPDQPGRGTVTLAVMAHFHSKIPKRGSIFKNYGNSTLEVMVPQAARSNCTHPQRMTIFFYLNSDMSARMQF
jgi:hypothetical protein